MKNIPIKGEVVHHRLSEEGEFMSMEFTLRFKRKDLEAGDVIQVASPAGTSFLTVVTRKDSGVLHAELKLGYTLPLNKLDIKAVFVREYPARPRPPQWPVEAACALPEVA